MVRVWSLARDLPQSAGTAKKRKKKKKKKKKEKEKKSFEMLWELPKFWNMKWTNALGKNDVNRLICEHKLSINKKYTIYKTQLSNAH